MKNENFSLRFTPLLCLLLSGQCCLLSTGTAAPAPKESIKSALPAGKVDDSMLASAEKMSADELRELMNLYLKKKDQLMAVKVANLLLKVNSEDQSAREVLARAGQPVAEDAAAAPPMINQARLLAAEGKHQEAVTLYEKALAEHDPKTPFPFAMELASAYDDADLQAQAITAYEAISKDSSALPADQQEATKRLTELHRDQQISHADSVLDSGNVTEARAIIAQLSADDQRTPDARILAGRAMLLAGETAAGEAALNEIIKDETQTLEARQEALTTLSDAKINRLIKDGEGAFDLGNHKLALSLSEEVYAMAPQRSDVVQFRAKTLIKNNQADQALQLLEKNPAGKDADSQCDHSRLLAQALEKTANFQRAITCYRELGGNPKLSLLDRDDALETAETLASFGSPRSAVDWRFVDAEEGRWNQVHLSFQTGILSHALQFIGEGFWDAISPSAGANFSGKTETDLLEASGALRAHFSGNHFVQAGMTGHRDGVGFSVSAGKIPLGGTGYQIRYDHQQRAAYSQALRSLNGRQNKVSGTLQTDLGAGVSLDTTVSWREIYVDQESIGNGVALELSLLKTLIKETASTPGVSIAYLGDYSRTNSNFTPEVRRAIGVGDDESSARMAELVDPRVNRHELQMSVVRHWTDALQTSASGAIGYEFEDEQSVWRIGLQAAYRLRPNMKLTLEADYDSSGQGANSGSAMKSLWLGLAVDY